MSPVIANPRRSNRKNRMYTSLFKKTPSAYLPRPPTVPPRILLASSSQSIPSDPLLGMDLLPSSCDVVCT